MTKSEDYVCVIVQEVAQRNGNPPTVVAFGYLEGSRSPSRTGSGLNRRPLY